MRENSLRRNVRKHYKQWETTKVQEMIVSPKNFMFVSLTLNMSFREGQLSSSQTQAVIVLIEKKDKDKGFLKNWRPISLINVDAKIASKAMAQRIKNIIKK